MISLKKSQINVDQGQIKLPYIFTPLVPNNTESQFDDAFSEI